MGRDPAVGDEGDLVSHPPGKAHLVGDQHELRTRPFEVVDHVEHLSGHLGVECGGWLVEKQPSGLHHQGPKDRDPLLLASGEFGRPLVGVSGEPKPLERFRDPPPGLGVGEAVDVNERQQEVVHRGEVGEEVVRLEDRADAAAVPAERLLVAGQGDTLEGHAARHRHVEPSQDSQQR